MSVCFIQILIFNVFLSLRISSTSFLISQPSGYQVLVRTIFITSCIQFSEMKAYVPRESHCFLLFPKTFKGSKFE